MKKISQRKASGMRPGLLSPSEKENGGPSTPVSLASSTPTTPKNLVKTPEEEQALIIRSLFTPIEEGPSILTSKMIPAQVQRFSLLARNEALTEERRSSLHPKPWP
jgi:hypothetical protein